MTGVLGGKQCPWEYFQVVNFAVQESAKKTKLLGMVSALPAVI
jgi:hypothetical protein